MRELPILMNGAMVRAVLEGRKTVTRRIVSPAPYRQPVNEFGDTVLCFPNREYKDRGWLWPNAKADILAQAPFQVSDRLYVRETTVNVEEHGYLGPVFAVSDEGVAVRDGGLGPADDDCEIDPEYIKLRTALHMPKAWARIWLEVTAVRVERLQDISEAQAYAEGVDNHMCAVAVGDGARMDELLPATVHGFAYLWDGLAKPGTRWADNPWVWAVEFRRVEHIPGQVIADYRGCPMEVPDGRS